MTARKILKLMVFDLDCTLWPFHVECSYTPPFEKKNGVVSDRHGHKMEPFPEALEVLEKWSKKCEIAAASRTHYAEGAEVLLKYYGFDKYITYKEIYPGQKMTHFESLKQRSNVDYKDMLFFDDESRNIRDIKPLGVECVLVDGDIGVTKKLVDDVVAKKFSDS